MRAYREGLALVENVLTARTRRIGECLISESAIQRLLRERLGYSRYDNTQIRTYLIQRLRESGFLTYWDNTNSSGDIFQVRVQKG